MSTTRRIKSSKTEIQMMNRPQMRIMLDYMGLPFSKHPSSVSEQEQMLELAKAENPDKFKIGFEAIVHHRFEPADGTAKKYSGLAEFVKEKITEYESEAILRMKNEWKDAVPAFLEALKNKAEADLKEAVEKVIVVEHHVKVGNKTPKKVSAILPEEFDTILQLAQQRKNILLVGPAGCGKTHIASVVAEALELPFATQSCTAGMSESALIGWLLPVSNGGKFSYVKSEFVDKYENGGVFLLDELDASDPNVMIFINQALANGSFHLPQRFENPLIKKHKDFIAIGAANTYGTGANSLYTGRNALDAATLDRFKVGTVEMKYSAIVEEEIIDPQILEWGRSVRKAIEKHNLVQIMSTRVLKDATDMKLNQDWTLDMISKTFFRSWSKEEMTIVNRELSPF